MHDGPIYTEYFEDIKLHQQYRSREYFLNEKEIIDFATVWDPQQLHIDKESAKNTKFGSLVASGIHLVAIGQKLANEMRPRPAWIAGLGWEKVQFLAPARSGDVLVLENEVIMKRESESDRSAGIVCYAARLLNQHNKLVLTYEGTALIERRHKL